MSHRAAGPPSEANAGAPRREGRPVRRELLSALLLGALMPQRGFAQGALARPPALTLVEPGRIDSAPLFNGTYVDLDNRAARLARPAGRGLIANFWARWCGPCKVEIPELAALHARRTGVDVLGINIEADPAPVRDFARAYEIDYPVLLAREPLAMMRALGNQRAGLPFTVVLDRRGSVVALRLGVLAGEQLEAATRLALA
ncbi:MAG: TlpA family protein disulfide reductase [Burkholderiales bacterium]|nr:TlpA family protein disulfide reductase [Burkholderiales bacterium]